MDSLIKIVTDHVLTNKRDYTFNEGHIVFLPRDKNMNEIYIRTFMLEPEFQQKGILTAFLKYLSDNFDEIWFFQCNNMMSCILLTTSLHNKYFTNRYTGEWYWKKNEDQRYVCDEAERIANILLPLRSLLRIKDLFHQTIRDNSELYYLL